MEIYCFKHIYKTQGFFAKFKDFLGVNLRFFIAKLNDFFAKLNDFFSKLKNCCPKVKVWKIPVLVDAGKLL